MPFWDTWTVSLTTIQEAYSWLVGFCTFKCLMLGHLFNILNLIFPNNLDKHMLVFRVKTILPDICGGFSGGEEGETNCGLASLRGGGILPCHLTTPIHHPNIPTSHHPHPTTPTSHYVPSFHLHHYHHHHHPTPVLQ